MIKMSRNDLCWCGSKKKYKYCHEAIDQKLLRAKTLGIEIPDRNLLKTQAQLNGIRESGKINILVLDAVQEAVCAGMSTGDIDRLVYQKTIAMGGIPAQLGYEGFPKSVCTSVNDQVCHGIPSDDVVLTEGDIINIDASTIYQGFFSDSSRMLCIGEVSKQSKELVQMVEESVRIGLTYVKPWKRIGDVGHAIHAHARKNGYSVVKDIGGHGIGLAFHEDPWVSFVAKAGTGMLMVPGMVFTIEPMINIGSADVVMDSENGWTVYTADGNLSAQCEVTVAVTEDGYEILSY